MVQTTPHGGPESAQLDRRAGRRATRAELAQRLSTAPGAYLSGALDNPAFAAAEAILLLRNRQATPAMLKRIAGVPGWVAERAVRKALVRHPAVATPLALRILPSLYWRDQAETCAATGVPAPVRHAAEAILRQRLDELASGERIALARLATRGVIPALAAREEAPVLVALLGNPRLREAEAQSLAARPGPGDWLAEFAAHPRWERNAAVLTALAANPGTPIRVALGLVARLDRQARQRLINNDKVPKIVRVAAERPPVTRTTIDVRETPPPRDLPRGHRS